MSFHSKLIALSFAGLTAGFAIAQTTQPTAPRPPVSPTQPVQPARPTSPAAPTAQQPARPAQPTAQPAQPARPAAAPAPAAAQTRKVNLNTATEAELDGLPQIGPARAKAIIEARTKNGRFRNWDDFVARNVIPKNAENAIKDRVSF